MNEPVGGTGYGALFRLAVPRRLVLAVIPADLADWLDYAAIVALLVFTWNEEPYALALFAIALSIPYILVGPFLAILTDRLPLRAVLVASNVGRGLVTIGLIFAGDTAVVLILVFLRSSIDSAFTPARQAAIQATTPTALLPAANGLHQAVNQTSKVIGPALGGLLLSVMTPQWVFAVNTLLSLAAAIVLATIAIPRATAERAEESVFRRALAGFAEFGRSKALRIALLFVAFAYFSFFLYDALVALLAAELGFDETTFGLSIAASGAGGILGALLAGRMTRTAPLRVMAAGALLSGLATVLLASAAAAALTIPLVLFFLALAFMGGSAAAMLVPYRTIIQESVAPDRIARVYAAGEAVTVAVMLSAPFIGSAIAERFGTPFAFLCGGVLLLILGIATIARRQRPPAAKLSSA